MKSTKDYFPKLRPFVFHGADIPNDPEQSTGTCPFCQKENHFGVKTKTGQFRCVKCNTSGNIHGFLKELHNQSLERTTRDDYETLAGERGVTPEGLKAFGLAKSIITDEWLAPAFNSKGALSNLSRCVKSRVKKDGKYKTVWRILSTPGCNQWPFGTKTLHKDHSTLWICEGLWDSVAMWGLLRTVRDTGGKVVRTAKPSKSMAATNGVIGPTGSGSFPVAWLDFVSGKIVYVVFDNDHIQQLANGHTQIPGWDGVKRIVKTCSEAGSKAPSELYAVKWGQYGYDDTKPDGYDLSDLLQDVGPVKTMRAISDKLEHFDISKPQHESPDPDDEVIEPIQRDSFDSLCEDFFNADQLGKRRMEFTQNLRDTLATALACVLSTELPHEQIWLRIIGPPGSGKSTIAEAISAAKDYAFPVSIQTGFHSGYSAGGGDASLIPQMDRKTVIIKDADTLTTSQSRDRILAELRDLYDGTSRSRYRNRKTNVYHNLRITFILCGTDDMRSLNRSSLGERFLDVEILGDSETDVILNTATDNAYESVISGLAPKESSDVMSNASLYYLKQVTVGFINHLKSNMRTMDIPRYSPKARKRIKALSTLVAYMRANVDRDQEGLKVRPRIELPTRLGAQLTKLSVCLALVMGKNEIDEECVRIVSKVATDTVCGFRFEMTNLLYRYRSTGLSARQIESELSIGEGTVRRMISDMRELKIIERDERPNNTGQRGRNRHVWRLTEQMQALIKDALK